MAKCAASAAVALAFVHILSLPVSAAADQAPPAGGTFQINEFTTGLASPTAVAFAPDGRLFVTEQAGRVRVVTADGQLLPSPFLTLSNVRSDGERGLLGLAFDPDFTANGYIYLFYTPSAPGARLSRVTANGNSVVANSEVTLFEYGNVAGNHRGGDIHFGPDGKLYLAIGDAGDPNAAQAVNAFDGKILRFNRDGTIPADNPATFTNTSGTAVAPAGTYRAIWAIGLRNPYRFAFDSTGRMHINDVGSDGWEEVNVGHAGGNYGWPTCEGVCANTSAAAPIYVHRRGEDGCAITGGVFYNADEFPASYRDEYFVIDYCNTWLRHFGPDNAVATFPLAIPRDSVGLKVGPDGALYVLNYGGGRISRITYTASGTNRNPVAGASASPTAGNAPLTVTFSGNGSSDPDGNSLTYAWDFGDGDTGGGVSTTHTYTNSGTFTATLTVSDGRGGSDSRQLTIRAGAPPAATITSPVPGRQYSAGETISFAATATDPEDGTLPASAFSWTILFHHDTHTHPEVGPITGVRNGSFTVPTIGHTEHTVFYRIYLTVTDSTGVQTQVTRDVTPRTATVTLNGTVAGAQVLLDGQPYLTPHSFVGVAGVQRTIEIPSPQVINGQTYLFSAWSDGGARSHTVNTPSTNTTYTATLQPQGLSLPTSVVAPAAHWKFDNNLTEAVRHISSSAKGSLAYSVEAATTGAPPASLAFAGDAGTYVVANGDNLLNGWTAATTSVWVNVNGAAAQSWSINSQHSLLSKYRTLTVQVLKEASGQLRLIAAHGDGDVGLGTQVVSTVAFPVNTWVHLATVHQGTTVTLYVNGQPAGSGNTGRTLGGETAERFEIVGYGGGFAGLVDDLKLFDRGLSAAEVRELWTAVGSPPSATITSPVQGRQYAAGETISFAASATDPEDGTLPPSAYSWTVLIHHDTHTHTEVGPITGVTSGSFTVPTSGHTEPTVFYRIYLTVTDSTGAQTRVTRDVTPRTATVTLNGSVAGAQVLLDGQPHVMPYSFVSIAGVQRTIEIPSPQAINGQPYLFSAWSDGGARTHTITTPATNTSYLATLQPQPSASVLVPTAHWRFDNNLAESVRHVSTSGKGSIVYSTNAATGGPPASVSFNGDSGTYVVASGDEILNGWTGATTAMWVNVDGASAQAWRNNTQHSLLSKYRTLAVQVLKDASGQLRFTVAHSDGGSGYVREIVSEVAFPANTWVHLATVHQGTTVTLYVNGQPAGSGNTGRTLGGESGERFEIVGYGGSFAGLIDDLKLFDRALSPEEVRGLSPQ